MTNDRQSRIDQNKAEFQRKVRLAPSSALVALMAKINRPGYGGSQAARQEALTMILDELTARANARDIFVGDYIARFH